MLLECRNIGYRYPESDGYAFKNISFSLSRPGFHAIFGPSGVGKTSFARVLTGEFTGITGELIKNKTSSFLYTYNQERLPGWASTGKHLNKITPDGKAGIRDKLVDIFGIAPNLKQRFSQLSLGQKNRINLIRYLVQDFDLLIMDESLANVDEALKEKIILAVKSLFPAKYFLYISHNLIEVSKFCDKILVFSGASKYQQASVVQGLDIHEKDVMNKDAVNNGKVDSGRLNSILLEIMNAC